MRWAIIEQVRPLRRNCKSTHFTMSMFMNYALLADPNTSPRRARARPRLAS